MNDTAGLLFERVSWNDIAIDELGRIAQINLISLQVNDTSQEYWYEINHFDTIGTRLLPSSRFLPTDLDGAKLSHVASRLECYSNRMGDVYVAALTASENRDGLRDLFMMIWDSLGVPKIRPKRVNNESDSILILYGYGAINNRGYIAAVWNTNIPSRTNSDSLFLRLYDYQRDSLSEEINISAQPWPNGCRGVYRHPQVALSDSRLVIVTWIEYATKKILLALFDRTLTMIAPIQVVVSSNEVTGMPLWVDIVCEADGDFYISWWGPLLARSCETRGNIWMSAYNSDGTSKYGPLRINDADSMYLCDGEESYPAMACDDLGNVTVTFADARNYPDGSGGKNQRDIFIQRINPIGNLIGVNHRLNSKSGVADLQGFTSRCAMNNHAQVVVSWKDFSSQNIIKGLLIPLTSVGFPILHDLNYDRYTNAADINLLIDIVFGYEVANTWPRSLVDCNTDGVNGNLQDIICLAEYLSRTSVQN